MKSKSRYGIIIPILLLLFCGIINAQNSAPPWAWAKVFYGTNILDIPAIAVDPSENGAVYATGSYLGTVDFDPGIGIFNLDSFGIYADMFISKLDVNGDFIWAKQISAASTGTGGSCRGNSIAIDPSGSGDVYTTGAFHGQVDFDPGPGAFILEYSGYSYHNPDVFVSKLDRSGNFKWAKRMGGTGESFGRSIVVDPSGSGDVYILGSFMGTIDFDPGADTYPLTSVGKFDFFITKLDSSGNFLWTKSIGGTEDDIGFAMTVDPKSGDLYFTGGFTGQVNFNPIESSHILTSGPSFDTFILKLDSEGNFVWVKPLFGTSTSKGGAGYGIAYDPGGSGAVYTTGYFEGEVDFNPDGKGIFRLNSAGRNDVFISKLDREGNFVWAKSIGGKYDDKGNGIAFDPEGNGGVYITGNFTQTVDLDPGPDVLLLTADISNDIFIAKFNSTGNLEWAKPVRANQANQNSAVALDGQSLYVTGLFLNPTISFDSLVVTHPSDPGIFWDVFIAKLDTILITSVDEINKHPINIYPNPAAEEITIEFEGEEFHDIGITLFTILGEVVYSGFAPSFLHKKTIDISSLAAGIYFLELDINGNRVIEKVVKEY